MVVVHDKAGPSAEIPVVHDINRARGLVTILAVLEDIKHLNQGMRPVVEVLSQVSRHPYLARHRSLRALLLFNLLGQYCRAPYFANQSQAFQRIYQGVATEVSSYVSEWLGAAISRQGSQAVSQSCGGDWERCQSLVNIYNDALGELVAHWGDSTR